MFDSLNHIESLPDLARVFAAVRDALAPGGAFLFDVNTEASYREQWDDTFGFADDDLACVVQVGFEEETRTGTFEAAVFDLERDGTWHREDVRLTQRPWEPEEVVPALAEAGFADIRHFDAADLGFEGAAGRVVFLARRSG